MEQQVVENDKSCFFHGKAYVGRMGPISGSLAVFNAGQKVFPGASGEPMKGYAAALDRTIYSEWDPRHIGWMGCL